MCQAGNEILAKEKAGVGNLSTLETNRLINTQYNCDLTALLGWNRVGGSFATTASHSTVRTVPYTALPLLLF